MATASNEMAMAADDAQPAVEARNGGAPARPPQPLVFGPNKAESWKMFRRRWSNFCVLSYMAAKPRSYQVAMLENSLGDEAVVFDFICKRCYNHKSISNQHSKCAVAPPIR